MEIFTAITDDDVEACFDVMHQLRPHLRREDFVARVKLQMKGGYRLAAKPDDQRQIVAVAGWRILHNLAWGRLLYVDDLVTDEKRRSEGFGDALFRWLLETAKREKCDELHLDSGVQRFDAHRFCLRQRMDITAHHFAIRLNPRK